MKLEMTFDAKPASRFVSVVFRDQLPYATSQALNDAAKAGQKAQVAHQRQVFTVRRPAFVDRAVKIKPFAKKTSLEARISVDPPGSRDDVIAQHEADARKTPFSGNSIAVPSSGLRAFGTVIPRKMRPSRLFSRDSVYMRRDGRVVHVRGKAQLHGSGRVFSRKTNVVRGAERTFLIKKPGGRGTIFQRYGPQRSDVRVLYQLVPSVDLDQRLKFVETVSRAASSTFDTAFAERFQKAVRTAR